MYEDYPLEEDDLLEDPDLNTTVDNKPRVNLGNGAYRTLPTPTE